MRIHSVCGPLDLDTKRQITGLGDPDAGVAVLRLLPGTRRRDSYRLFHGLNLAVGGDPDVLTGNTTADQEQRFATAWYRIRGIEQLVVHEADAIPDGLLADLASWCRQVGLVEMWLVSHASLDAGTRAALGGAVEDAQVRELLDVMPEHSTPPEGPRPLLPDGLCLPEVDFVVARAEARKRLPQELFAAYDHIWSQAFTQTIQMVDGVDEDPCDEAAACHLQELWDCCHNRAEMRAAADGVRAGLLTRGLRLAKFDLHGLLARAAARPTPAQLSALHFHRLFAYRRPWRAAVVALYAAGINVEQIQAVRLLDVDLAEGTVTSRGETVTLPRGALDLVDAQLLVRQQVTEHDHEPLIVHDEDHELVRADTIVRQLQAAQEEVGFPLEHTLISRTADRSAVASHLIRVERVAEVNLPVDLTTPAEPEPVEPAGDRAKVGAAVRRRRRELDVTIDELARHLGLRRRAVVHVEDTGQLDGLSGQQLLDLADHLELDLHRQLQGVADGTEGDAQQLGSLLFKAKALLPWEIICDETGWSMQQADAAADELSRALDDAGLGLRDTRGKVGIVAQHDAIDAETAQQVLRRHRPRRTLGVGDARQLLHTLDPTVDPTARPGRARRRLHAAGMLTDDDTPTLSDDVVFSLGLAPRWLPQSPTRPSTTM